MNRMSKKNNQSVGKLPYFIALTAVAVLVFYFTRSHDESLITPLPHAQQSNHIISKSIYRPAEKWLQRAYEIDSLYHVVYTPCWEGAYGAIGDSYLFAATHDTALLQFHLIEHDL